MSCIYIIKNDINDKVYIGQTTQRLSQRFNQHIQSSNNDKSTSKLHVAMRELGVHHFYIEKLLDCSVEDLNKYEQQLVEEYNSLNNGYNTVYPCSSINNKIHHQYEDKVIDMYLAGYSFANIAKAVNISIQHANNIILEHNINREYYNNGSKGKSTKPKPLVMYDISFNPIQEFNSISSAYNWIKENTNFNVTEFGAYTFIDVACQNGNISYGHRWQFKNDLVYKDKIFRTRFDRDAYIDGSEAYKVNNYWVAENTIENLKTVNVSNYCKDCGKKLNSKRNKRCFECNRLAQQINSGIVIKSNKLVCTQCKRIVGNLNNGLCQSCYNVKLKGKSPKPSKEELEALLNKGLAKKEIAKIYGRTDSTIHYWIKSYKIVT